MLFSLLIHSTTAAYQEVHELDVRTFQKVHDGDHAWCAAPPA